MSPPWHGTEGEGTPRPDATSPSPINERNVSEEAAVCWFAGTRARELLSVCWPLSRSPAGFGAWQGRREPPATCIWLAESWTRPPVGSTSPQWSRVPLRAHQPRSGWGLRRMHPAKPRWDAGWQLPPGHTAKESFPALHPRKGTVHCCSPPCA